MNYQKKSQFTNQTIVIISNSIENELNILEYAQNCSFQHQMS